MDSFLKYLDPRSYKYDSGHDQAFARSDTKIISAACFLTFAVMLGILILIAFRPDLRYDSGLDNVPKLIVTSVAGFLGFIFGTIPVSHSRVISVRCSILRFYLGALFLGLSLYSFYMSDAKADAVFTYLIYCFTSVAMLHVNPVLFSIQAVAYAALTLDRIDDYFGSVGTTVSYCGLMFCIVFLSFYTNTRKRTKAANEIRFAVYSMDLRRELDESRIGHIRDQMAMQEGMIMAVAELVENRDLDTGTHVKATAFYAKLIADGAVAKGVYPDEIDAEFAYLIEKAAPMHDLGKISVPDAILKAPRRLTDEEFAIMKRHTVNGAAMIRQVYEGLESAEYIECAANIALYHHERWDGKGYPHGIAGDGIPVEARIMAIADVFDALTSRRCYKEAFPLSEAFGEISRCAGTQFDPELVKVFLEYRSVIEDMIVDGFEKC